MTDYLLIINSFDILSESIRADIHSLMHAHHVLPSLESVLHRRIVYPQILPQHQLHPKQTTTPTRTFSIKLLAIG